MDSANILIINEEFIVRIIWVFKIGRLFEYQPQIVGFFLNLSVLVDSRILDTSNTIWGGNLLASIQHRETLNYF